MTTSSCIAKSCGPCVGAITCGGSICSARLRGDFDPEQSDLDFLVEFDRGAPQHPFEAYFGLKEALEELFARPVDLVEAGAVRNPYLEASIERSRQNLYAA